MMKTLGLTLFFSLALPLNAMAANGLQKQKTYFPFNSYALWDNTTAGWEWKMHKIENGLQQPLYSLPKNIKSQRLVCYNLTQGLLIEGKNQRQSMAPASMTKLMTLVVACDLITDWQKPMEVTKAICARVAREGASKAGYTRKAGQCLASFAYFNGDIYTLVTAGAPGELDGDQQHIIDSSNIYNHL